MQYVKDLEALDACPDFVDWLQEANHPTWEEAWAACPYGDFLIFVAALFSGPVGSPGRVPAVLAACECAELVKTAESLDEWPGRWAVEAAREFAAGNGDIRRVAHQAERAGRAAGRWARAAQFAANVAWHEHAIHAAGAASSAASTAAECEYFLALNRGGFAAADTASEATLLKCAEIVRRYFPKPPKR